MKNPELLTANGIQKELSIMFHKDNCSVIAIQEATEDSVTGQELVENLNNLRLFRKSARETPDALALR